MDFVESPSKNKKLHLEIFNIFVLCNVTTNTHIQQHISIPTNNITVYAHYADTRKINIQTIVQLFRFQALTTQA